jgi:hypothetical protein
MLNKKRLLKSYPDDIKQATNLIAFNPDKIIYYGSASKKSMYLSSGDIDLVEPVKLSEANSLAKHIKIIVHNIDKTKNCYLADFKSGIDQYYNIDLGTIKHGKIIGFDKKKVKDFITSKQFNDNTEKKKILNLFNNPIGLKQWFDINNFLHEYQVLRWDKDELLKGYKIIRGDKVYLQDTIQDKTALTKLDIIQFIPSLNRFVEITNYFDVVNDGKEFKSEKYMNDLKTNLLKYYYEKNYFKFTKRMLAYSLFIKDEATSNKLYTIVDSGAGIMYQCESELVALKYIIDHYDVPKEQVNDQLQAIKLKLGNVYEFSFNEEKLDELIDEGKIDEIINMLYESFNSYTLKKLKELKMIPIKKEFIP